MTALEPRRPRDLDEIAVALLEALGREPSASNIVLGGGVALKHYLDHRPTHDIDAWWADGPEARTREALLRTLRAVAQRYGLELRTRLTRRGEMEAYDFCRGERAVFSFQIATRDVELDSPVSSPWGHIRIETLADNLGAKMNALVSRGAPRDFIDLKAACDHGLVSVEQLWTLWQKKNATEDLAAAKREVIRHLEAIETRNPLDRVPAQDRPRIEELRSWYREQFAVSAPKAEESST